MLSGFGLTGPYADVAQQRRSATGPQVATCTSPASPIANRSRAAARGTPTSHGAIAAVGAAAAVIHAARTGEGQVVDVGAMEALASMHQWTVTMYTHIGTVKRRWGNLLGESSHPIGLYRCSDGYVSIVAVTPAAVGVAVHRRWSVATCSPTRR